jgi:hypothetical protein
MAKHDLANEELLAQIVVLWLRHRGDPSLNAMPRQFRELLDEAARRGGINGEEPWTEMTPTETPASRRKK